jgi:beta-1,4-N-acetylglucosaminyltransferase
VSERWLLVASSGGHLRHLLWLRELWADVDRRWVTFDTPDARAALADEAVDFAAFPTNRSLKNLAINTVLAGRVLRAHRPTLVISAGAAVAVPFLGVAVALGVPTVHLEVYDRVDRPAWTTRLVAPWVDRLILQWPAQRAALGRGVVLGPIR